MFDTCLSLRRDLPAGFGPLDGVNVDSVEDTGPQTGQPIRSAARPHWDFLARAFRGGVG